MLSSEPTSGLKIEGVLAYLTHLKCEKHIGDDVGDMKCKNTTPNGSKCIYSYYLKSI
jgi:hypothetical protein